MTAKPQLTSQVAQEPLRLTLARPDPQDAAAIRHLIRNCHPLDLNSTYAYLLLSRYFRDTCVIARGNSRLLGYVSAFRAPADPGVLVVWQVAVHPDARGQSLGPRMISHLLKQAGPGRVTRIETTVSPSNQASIRMFESVARHLDAPIRKGPLFSTEMFGDEPHEAEDLYAIGPFSSLKEN